jgi:hypothetical protein
MDGIDGRHSLMDGINSVCVSEIPTLIFYVHTLSDISSLRTLSDVSSLIWTPLMDGRH